MATKKKAAKKGGKKGSEDKPTRYAGKRKAGRKR
jgi:hypothetical protein